jgi:uncharacterized protein (UPF0261 family)
MVSTLAAGDVGRCVDVADISMMPSVTDLAGLNIISRTVLRNAAFGIVHRRCGAVRGHRANASSDTRPTV